MIDISHPQYRHGLSHSRVWRIWRGMKYRCLNQKSEFYADYGGRGIKVCERWLIKIENFVSDMGIPPKGMTLDRIDNDGDYEPMNCRWASRTQQAQNRRSSLIFSIDGKEQSLAAWIDEIAVVKTATVYARISKGWGVVQALTEPTHIEKRNRRFQCSSMT